jgi:hypothetical protein
MFRLVEQAYRAMAERFHEVYGTDFPLRQFSERVYDWRKSGEPYITTDGFEREVAALTEDRLMIRRTEVLTSAEGETHVNRWFFRHDKIMEFFLLPAFMDDKKARRYKEHLDEYEPFIGVYELLAVRLPDEEDQRLHKHLIERAAETRSHDLLDRYTLARRFRPLVLQSEHPAERAWGTANHE